jgi:hypothetical protein
MRQQVSVEILIIHETTECLRSPLGNSKNILMMFSIFYLDSQVAPWKDSSQPQQNTHSLPFPFQYYIQANKETIHISSKGETHDTGKHFVTPLHHQVSHHGKNVKCRLSLHFFSQIQIIDWNFYFYKFLISFLSARKGSKDHECRNFSQK